MYYVYIIQSKLQPERFYTGFTENLNHRLAQHNAGESIHTNKHLPWKLKTYIAFDDKQNALKFETYLKSGSGRSFAKKRF